MSLELHGIDGASPLGYMAALGALALAADALDCPVRLRWVETQHVWRAHVEADQPFAAEKLTTAIVEAHLTRDLEAELGWEKDIMKLSREDARKLISSTLGGERGEPAEMVGACLSELPPRRRNEDLVPYTPFRVIPRVGRARFLATALALSDPGRPEDAVRHALFEEWSYTKSNSLRWDPGATLAARAYTAEAPTHFGPLGVPGAMLLAVTGLRYFPLMLSRGRAACRGFGHSRGRVLVWPMWGQPLNPAALRLLLGLPELYEARPDPDHLRRHGVLARMVARRERVGDDDEVLSWGEPRRLYETEVDAR